MTDPPLPFASKVFLIILGVLLVAFLIPIAGWALYHVWMWGFSWMN